MICALLDELARWWLSRLPQARWLLLDRDNPFHARCGRRVEVSFDGCRCARCGEVPVAEVAVRVVNWDTKYARTEPEWTVRVDERGVIYTHRDARAYNDGI